MKLRELKVRVVGAVAHADLPAALDAEVAALSGGDREAEVVSVQYQIAPDGAHYVAIIYAT
jgi:hypothetical protein